MPYLQGFSTPTTRDDLDPLYLVAHALIIGCISERSSRRNRCGGWVSPCSRHTLDFAVSTILILFVGRAPGASHHRRGRRTLSRHP
jgi:hypothetical protein